MVRVDAKVRRGLVCGSFEKSGFLYLRAQSSLTFEIPFRDTMTEKSSEASPPVCPHVGLHLRSERRLQPAAIKFKYPLGSVSLLPSTPSGNA